MSDSNANYDLIVALIQFSGAALLASQVYFVWQESKNRNYLEKKLAAATQMQILLKDFRSERMWLDRKDTLTLLKKPSKLSVEERIKLELILGYMERIAIGVDCDLYDIEIIRRTSRRFIVTTFMNCKPYIDWKRRRLNNPKIFCELEVLTSKLTSDVL